jgi:hypothetical protein
MLLFSNSSPCLRPLPGAVLLAIGLTRWLCASSAAILSDLLPGALLFGQCMLCMAAAAAAAAALMTCLL